jgi:hypothetical protein
MFHRRACSAAGVERLAVCLPNPLATDIAAVAEKRIPNNYDTQFLAVSLFQDKEPVGNV